MTHQPTEGMCQGNFAASVKEILPIHECEALAVIEPDPGIIPAQLPRIATQALDRPGSLWRN